MSKQEQAQPAVGEEIDASYEVTDGPITLRDDHEKALWRQVYAAAFVALMTASHGTLEEKRDWSATEAKRAVLAYRKAAPADANKPPACVPMVETDAGVLQYRIGDRMYIRTDQITSLIADARIKGIKQGRDECMQIAQGVVDNIKTKMACSKIGVKEQDNTASESELRTAETILRRIKGLAE